MRELSCSALTHADNAGVINGSTQIAQQLATDGNDARVFTYDMVSLFNAYVSTPSKYNLSNVAGGC